ncbi:MAG: hypothetical protein NHB32_26025 [Fischerella sp. CENA71]|nr:hypothetical protein [Fischerella sp. CENA71]
MTYGFGAIARHYTLGRQTGGFRYSIPGVGMLSIESLASMTELKAEFASGQKVMADLEAKQTNLQDTLLRISGAIQIARRRQ